MGPSRPRAPSRAMPAVLRGLGELMVTAGVVVLLFCGYQLVWTNVEAGRAQDVAASDLEARWAAADKADARADGGAGGTGGDTSGAEQPPAPAPPAPGDVSVDQPAADPAVAVVAPEPGESFAFIRIPRLGEDYRVPIVEGVSTADLARGVGHYEETALPGEVGNFAVAGHRATNGEVFAHLDRVRPGDEVVIETADTWLTYVVEDTEIVAPDAVEVIAPVPGRPGVEPTVARMTLTTCNPRWASYERLIVYTALESTRAKSDGTPPALQAAGG